MRSIVVPVDGSALAEYALMPAAELARRHGARLWLAVVHPWGAEEAAPLAGSADDRLLRRRDLDYLRELQDRLADTFGIEVARRVLEGDRAPVPPEGFQRLLVALDGSRLAEASLGPALALLDPHSRHVTLLRVISPLAPGLRDRRRRALAYLLQMVASADLVGADLIAVTTRERGTARRAALGSVADAVVRQGRAPILICHSPTKPRATPAPRRRRRRTRVG
jgi:nucleotide-binding universal stress UspA family protein